MSGNYLLKTEPSEYSFADLQKDKETVWEGVKNPTAVMHMRGMKAGDRLIIYETGGVRSAVGTGTVISVDAGKAQFHEQDKGPGVHAAHWGDTKVACLQTYENVDHDKDPKP